MEDILDKALRTAVVRLADSDNAATPSNQYADTPIDRSDRYSRRQPQYPTYDYEPDTNYDDYYDYSDYNDYNDYSVYKPKSKDYRVFKPQAAPPWATPRPPAHPRRPNLPPLRPPPNRPPFIPQRDKHALERVDSVDSVGGGLVSWLPGLALLPIIAGLSYYFVVENAPTPVVRERGGETVISRREDGSTNYKVWQSIEQLGESIMSAVHSKARSAYSMFNQNCAEDEEEISHPNNYIKCQIYQRISKMFMDYYHKVDLTKEKNNHTISH